MKFYGDLNLPGIDVILSELDLPDKKLFEYTVKAIDFNLTDEEFKKLCLIKPTLLYLKKYLEGDKISIDLDFNIETENRTKEFILTKFRELNEKLEREDLLVPASETKYKTKSSENLIYQSFFTEYSTTTTTITTFHKNVT